MDVPITGSSLKEVYLNKGDDNILLIKKLFRIHVSRETRGKLRKKQLLPFAFH